MADDLGYSNGLAEQYTQLNMIFFGPTSFRRQRAARLSAVGESSYWGRFGDALTDRNVLLRMLLCLLAIGLLLVAVEAWRAPFNYRLGDHQPHGVLAQVPFKRVNRFETDRLRAQIEDQVPFVFRLEATAPRQLLASLKTDLEEIAHAETLESVRASTRSAFGVWTEGDRPMDDMTPEKYEREFRSLKAAIYSGSTFDPEAIDLNQAMPDDMADRVALLLDDMREFLTPLQRSGRSWCVRPRWRFGLVLKPLTPTNNLHYRCDRANRSVPVRILGRRSRQRFENVASLNHSGANVSRLQQIVKCDSRALRHIRRPSRPIAVSSWSPKPPTLGVITPNRGLCSHTKLV